jgi:hypothetical protein
LKSVFLNYDEHVLDLRGAKIVDRKVEKPPSPAPLKKKRVRLTR